MVLNSGLIAGISSERKSLEGKCRLIRKAILCLIVLLATSFSLGGMKFDTSFVSAYALAGTDVGGAIATNTTWTVSGSPYRVTADVLVLVGISLNVEPGVVVRFENGTSIVVDGTFMAQGDSAHKILFTSNLISPALGDWGSIRTRTGGRIMSGQWITIEYSSGGIEFPADSSHIVSDCVFHANGVGIAGSNVNVTRCTFDMNTRGVNAVNVQVADCEFFNNTNGVFGSGICSVQNTYVWNNSGFGIDIAGSVSNCLVHDNGGDGVLAAGSIVDCLVYNNAGHGIQRGSPVVNCSVFNNGGVGIAGGSAYNCSVYGNGGYGVSASIIANCSIHDNGGYGARGSTIANSSVFNNKGYGVSLQRSVLSECRVYNNSAGGAIVFAVCTSRDLVGSPYSLVEKTQIYENLVGIRISLEEYGTPCRVVYLNVVGSNISDNFEGGIVTDELYNCRLAHCAEIRLSVSRTLIESNGRFGIRLNATEADDYNNPLEQITYYTIDALEDCTIANHTVGALGIFTSVTGSNITNNSQIGLLGVYGTGNIIGNNISGNGIGLDVYSAGSIIGNNIYGNGIYNVRNHLPFGQDLNATMNWWGTTNATQIGAFIYDYYEDYNLSRVLFEPYLDSPIPEFPSFLLLPLSLIAMVFTSAVGKRNRHAKLKGRKAQIA